MKKLILKTLKKDFKVKKIRFDKNVGIGIKPISEEGTSRLVKKAIDYAYERIFKFHKLQVKNFKKVLEGGDVETKSKIDEGLDLSNILEDVFKFEGLANGKLAGSLSKPYTRRTSS